MKMNGIRAGRVGTRLLSALLSLIMALSLLPGLAVDASAASRMEPYLEKLVSWGVMRGDSSGNLHPDRTLTRAEFVVLVNRAFGYSDVSPTIPFRDVKASDWYYDDINIGYTTGYFNGTSKTTASPRNSVSREQAATLLGRNLALDDEPGASIDFTDSNKLSNYSRGLIRSAVVEGILSGYGDGSFRPKQSITRGQMAVLLANAVGTPVSKSGAHTLGSVFGNVTISAPGATLKDTTIAGNLYITGGLSLGSVTLENVTVLGKIVVCGAGESEKGGNSVILRGVTAPTLILDNLAGNTVSVRAEGSTKIDQTSVRTSSYVEDASDDSHGFTALRVEGEAGTALSAAGNLKEIVTVSPNSAVTVAKGSVRALTVDERATGSSVAVLSGAAVKILNLDTGAAVTGRGDVEQLNVNANGAKADMLPDTIAVRPGVTANISGQVMDTTLAAEASAAPRLLAGYPRMIDVASASAKGLLRTNKAGTLYWALTSVTDGSVGEADLLRPSNNAKILKSGTIKAEKSDTDYTAAVTGLTADGSYYLSALLVDQREQRSPVKAVSFATPDDTVPGFATGYPYMSVISNISGEVTVMTTKSCRLYYALMPKNATAPTGADFKSGSLSGNLGFGSKEMLKNVSDTFSVNQKALKELESYDLYLWLTDADGAKSSAVKKLSFTTVDRTPPQFKSGPAVSDIKEKSVGLTAVVNEDATIFWVAVKEGVEYPKPMNGQTVKPALDSPEAKIQVSNGLNGLKAGKAAATANKDASVSITGLESETAYDVYFVAQDKSGNFSATVGKLTIHTLDNNPPSITQEFTRTNDAAGTAPLADTDIRIVFSENVQDSGPNNEQLLALYQKSHDARLTPAEQAAAADSLTGLLREDIQLLSADVTPAAQVVDRTSDSVSNWVIDYRRAKVTAEEGKIVVTFKAGEALNLKSGAKYFFKIQNIADTSTNKNIIKPNPTTLPTFTTVFAQVNLASSVSSGTVDGSTVNFDMSFKVVPVSTKNAADNVKYDLVFRTASHVSFRLYTRTGESGSWSPVNGDTAASLNPSADGIVRGASYARSFLPRNSDGTTPFVQLNQLSANQEFGIKFTSLDGSTDSKVWNGKVELEVLAVAGSDYSNLNNLSQTDLTAADLSSYLSPKGSLTQVSTPSGYTLRCIFTDTVAPSFEEAFPVFRPGDVSAVINVQLSRSSGRIYYVVAPVETIRTILGDGLDPITKLTWNTLPTTTGGPPTSTSTPTSSNIMNSKNYASNKLIKTGQTAYSGSTIPITLTGLEPKTQYCAYFVLQGDSQNVYTLRPYIFRFETTEVSRPIITLDIGNPNVSISADKTSTVDYLLAVNGKEPGGLKDPMLNYAADPLPFKAGGEHYGNGTGDGGVYTVLDAMSEDYRDESNVLRGSVFDQYAQQAAKDRFATYIRAQATITGDITLKGQTDVVAGGYKTVSCSPGMSGPGWYTFLTVGKSAVGSGDAFRAIRPVFNTDDKPPMIMACNFVPEGEITSKNGACNGTLTLQFSEELYWVVKSGVNQTIIPITNTTVSDPYGTYFAAGMAFEPGLGSGITYVKGSGSSTAPVSTVLFSFQNARPGSSLTATAQIGDKSGNLHRVPLNLVLQYTANNDGTGTYSPYFIITKDWDAH